MFVKIKRIARCSCKYSQFFNYWEIRLPHRPPLSFQNLYSHIFLNFCISKHSWKDSIFPFLFQLLYCLKILSSGEQSIIVKLLKIRQRFLQHTPVSQYRSIDRDATTARDRSSSGRKRGQEEQKHQKGDGEQNLH